MTDGKFLQQISDQLKCNNIPRTINLILRLKYSKHNPSIKTEAYWQGAKKAFSHTGVQASCKWPLSEENCFN